MRAAPADRRPILPLHFQSGQDFLLAPISQFESQSPSVIRLAEVMLFSQLDLGSGESDIQVANASVMLVAVFGACVLCTCVSFGCFMLTGRKTTSVTKTDKLAEFESYVLTGKEKLYKQRVSPATDDLSQEVTVCIANARQNTRDTLADVDSTSTATPGSPLPSPTSTVSKTSQMAPLASPCSVASVASQPARMSPLPSPSTLSISSISAVLQSPAHSTQGTSDPNNETVFLPVTRSPSLSSLGSHGSPSRSPKRRPTLPSVSETEMHASTEPAVDHPHTLGEEQEQPKVVWL